MADSGGSPDVHVKAGPSCSVLHSSNPLFSQRAAITDLRKPYLVTQRFPTVHTGRWLHYPDVYVAKQEVLDADNKATHESKLWRLLLWRFSGHWQMSSQSLAWNQRYALCQVVHRAKDSTGCQGLPGELSSNELYVIMAVAESNSIARVVGSEKNLKEYNENRRVATEGAEKDWTAMYTQFRVSHALGTVPYRWDQRGADGQPYTTASLLEARFMEPLPVVVAHGGLFADGAVEGSMKAQVVKEHLGLNVEEPLMKQLGAQGKALLMQETEEEWELIFSHQHLAALEHQTRVVASFKKSPARPITGSWETPDEGPMKYADDELVMETLRDLGEILREETPAEIAAGA
ncbi:unnamed protein product [Symbiodinium sp. CCMP2592]|nr:unnamed protein product [Symbiodinium sp. CCMP2592]